MLKVIYGIIGGVLVKEIRVGDIVTRRSYGGDIFFRVEVLEDRQGSTHNFRDDAIEHRQGNAQAILRGLSYRLCADAPLLDLEKKNLAEINMQRQENDRQQSRMVMQAMKRQGRDYQPRLQYSRKDRKSNFFELPGRVLHLDGDYEFRSVCQQRYLQMGVPCRVVHVSEDRQADVVVDYLREDRPDILVLTGHDSLVRGARNIYEMKNYRHSQFYVEAICKARDYEPDLDDLIIIAGGCESYFEALIEAGANFASAPKRVRIRDVDPLLVAQNIAFTSIYDKISLPEFLGEIRSGGIGGVQTRGKLRLGHPRVRCVNGKKKPQT
jgi:spore coat assembly protein